MPGKNHSVPHVLVNMSFVFSEVLINITECISDKCAIMKVPQLFSRFPSIRLRAGDTSSLVLFK
jgi:hypothetical protein